MALRTLTVLLRGVLAWALAFALFYTVSVAGGVFLGIAMLGYAVGWRDYALLAGFSVASAACVAGIVACLGWWPKRPRRSPA